MIRNGRLVDGTGNAWSNADVGIVGDRIAAIGSLAESSGSVLIDATGMVVSPGFIDIHTHVLAGLRAGDPIEGFLRDGVTTVIDGNDGNSAWPIGQTLDELEAVHPSLNVGTFAGLSPIRKAVLDIRPGAASENEIARLQDLVERALREGAFGLTSGLEPMLYHWPGYFTTSADLARMLAPVARADALYVSHIRDEAAGLMAAVRETIDMARQAGVRTDITHVKQSGRPTAAMPAKW
jgi:N-acyl-D-aspartate/D-glutamate deacylase